MRTGVVFNVQKYSVHDGPGIRTTVFFKGCPLSCWWCQNPESQGGEPFVHYDRERCLGCETCMRVCPEGALSLTADGIVTDPTRCRGEGACAEACPAEARRAIGREVTVGELMEEIEADRLYYEESGGGVTFSGGEPLLQSRFLLDMLGVCGERDLHRTVDTSGFGAPDAVLRVAEETDLFLYDLKVMDPAVHRQVTGVPVAPILDNLARLLSAGARVWIRIPLVPGITSDDSIDETGDYLCSLPPVDAIHLLPFHRSARDKHRKFGKPWRLESSEEALREQVDRWAGRLEDRGFQVAIGG